MRRSYVLIKNWYSLSVNILTKIITTHLTIESEMICKRILNGLFNVFIVSDSSILSAAENTLYFMSIDPVYTSFIMLMTSDLLIATLSSFNYFNRLKQSTGISYCDITRYNFNSIYSLISDKPCFIAIKHKTLKLVGYLFSVFSFYHSLHCLYLVSFDYSIFNYQIFCISLFLYICPCLLIWGNKCRDEICGQNLYKNRKIGIWFCPGLKKINQ